MRKNSDKPKLIRNCRLSGTDMLLMPEGVLKLKGTGSAIVALCDGAREVDEILSELKAQFPGADPAQVEAEAVAFLNTLREKRVMDF